MLFNSWVFIAFFIVVYSAYLALRGRLRWQNLLLLAASYLFYGWWDWRFLCLLIASSTIDFFLATSMGTAKTERSRRALLWASCLMNLSVLGFFKYFDFFADSAVRLLNSVGMAADPLTLHILLPVGISFYTFQGLSYTIDVYRGDLKPTRNYVNFALFVSFFPQLVAGPIERATALLPQVEHERRINWSMVDAGVWLVLWGFFKKVVVADNLAPIVASIFGNHEAHAGIDLAIGALAFTFQIYGDFSGYTDIARGIARFMGFELMLNFRLPYFAASPSDFWSRWHISLSTWLRDYLYVPLGGNRIGPWRTYRNLMLTMLLGGLWHGASWIFVIWGAYHGALLILYRPFEKRIAHFRGLRRGVSIAMMFVFTVIGWIIFRAESADQLGYFLTHMSATPTLDTLRFGYRLVFYAAPVVIVHTAQLRSGNLLIIPSLRAPARLAIYSLLLFMIALFGARETVEFIYFQF